MSAFIFVTIALVGILGIKFYFDIEVVYDVLGMDKYVYVTILGVIRFKVDIDLSKAPPKLVTNVITVLIKGGIGGLVDVREFDVLATIGVERNAFLTATYCASVSILLNGLLGYFRVNKNSNTSVNVIAKYNKSEIKVEISCIFGISIADIIYSMISYFSIKKRRRIKYDNRT